MQGLKSFLNEIINSTIDFCPIYKPNFAFFENIDKYGFSLLEHIVEVVNSRAIVIADAKRGDIGNTAKHYASKILDKMGFDAITLSPYMGSDSISPFIKNKYKGAFVLCVTSNKSISDIQLLKHESKYIYEYVLEMSFKLSQKNKNLGLVIGSTNINKLDLEKFAKTNMPILVPGIGAQGGNLEESLKLDKLGNLTIINVSRDIIYYKDGSIESIVESALNYTKQIRKILNAR